MNFIVVVAVNFLFFINLASIIVFAITPSSQIDGLEILFNATNGTHWIWRDEALYGTKWSFNSPQSDPCGDAITNKVWQGITCSSPPNICKVQDCDIISLELDYYGLVGDFPSEFFSRMISLTLLRITLSRQLTGPLPPEISKLSQLTFLSLSYNQLTGTIPTELGLLTQLIELRLFANQFTGSIPPELGRLNQLIELRLFSNRFTGSIPTQLGLLSQLNYFALYDNQLVGTIPPEIGSFSHLKYLFLDTNKLSGSIPSQISSLSKLNYITLYLNQLTGSLPSQLGLLPEVVEFAFDDNFFTGTIPSALGSLSQLLSLDLSGNQLSGTIPVSLSSFSLVYFFDLESNYFSGTLPSELCSLSQLKLFDIAGNHFTGTIPLEFSTFSLLNYFSMRSNELTGTLPPSLFNKSLNLKYLSLNSNHLSGTIPSEIERLITLEELRINDNFFTGTIPTSIINLKYLASLHLHQNHLNGKINFQLDSLPALEQLFLQQNNFHGQLHQLFFSPSISLNSSTNHPLVNIDVSDNQFSGSIPSQLFLYQKLQSISLSLNCFQHELPLSICEAVGVEVISMDGLGSSKHCPNLVKIPFTSVSLVQSIDGSIPDCVWLLSNLKMLNLAGNGLSGTIGKISSMSSLLSLTLSHNYLSGTIPLWLQEKNLNQLDLSHNKITGRVNGLKNNKNQGDYNEELIYELIGSKFGGPRLKLSVNRLSGELSHSFRNYSSLNILSGNLFGCDYLPNKDDNSDSTICGSEEFDQSMFMMGGVCGLIFILVIFYGLCYLISILLSSLSSHKLNSNLESVESQKINRKNSSLLIWCESRLVDLHSMIRFMKYYSVDDLFLRDTFMSIRSFGYFLSHLIKSVCLLTIVSLILSLPIYILKVLDVKSQNEDGDEESNQLHYSTHSVLYRWLWTMSFVSGTIPSVLLMVVTLVCLMIFCLILNGLGSSSIQDITNILKNLKDIQTIDSQTIVGNHNAKDNISLSNQPNNPCSQMNSTTISLFDDKSVNKDHQYSSLVWIIFGANIAVVGAVNALYLWSTLVDLSTNIRILIQFSFGFFTLVWRIIILRAALPIPLQESIYGVWLFTCLNIVNTVIIPCIVTALSNPSCYQRLLIPPDDISSSYFFQTCYIYFIFLDGGAVSCVALGPALMDPLKITPPFSYSYQCGSTLLVSYIPVYMYAISFQLLSVFVKLGITLFISSNSHRYWLMKWISPINFPSQITNIALSMTANSSNFPTSPLQIMKPYEIISIVMNNLILLLSFGLCSPVFGCYITLNICVTLWSWLILIGRFVVYRHDLQHSSNSAIIATSRILKSTHSNGASSLESNNMTLQLEMNPIMSSNHLLKDQDQIRSEHAPNANINTNTNTLDSIGCSNTNVNTERMEGGGRQGQGGGDEFLNLLNAQLKGVNSSLLVCKWPVVCTSCLFMSLLCWDMAGDEVGWFEALWVPGMGVAMLITIWIWDHFLISRVIRNMLKLLPLN